MGTIYRNGVPFAGSFDAGGVNYDHSSSGLSATNVQAAVDEVNGKVDDNAGDITALNNGLTPETLSLSSSYTLTNASFRMGKLIAISFKASGITASGNIELATIQSGYAPSNETPIIVGTNQGVVATGWIRGGTGVIVLVPSQSVTNIEARVFAVYHI